MRQNLFDSELQDCLFKGAVKLQASEALVAGAIPLNTPVTRLTSTGAGTAYTLADGVEGQIKTLIHVTDGGTAVITPANFGGATSATITLTNAGDSITLLFTAGAWWGIAFHSDAAVTGSSVTKA
jgi:hypothetical protein